MCIKQADLHLCCLYAPRTGIVKNVPIYTPRTGIVQNVPIYTPRTGIVKNVPIYTPRIASAPLLFVCTKNMACQECPHICSIMKKPAFCIWVQQRCRSVAVSQAAQLLCYLLARKRILAPQIEYSAFLPVSTI